MGQIKDSPSRLKLDDPIQLPSSTSQPPPTKPPSRHPHFFLNNVREPGLPSCFTQVLVRGLVATEDKAELTVSWCGSPGPDNTCPDPCLCCSRTGQNQHQTPTHFCLQRRKGRSSAHAPGLCTNPRLLSQFL